MTDAPSDFTPASAEIIGTLQATIRDLRAALRAQHKASQEAMREDIAMLCDTAGFPAFAKQIRALPIEEPTP